MTSAPDQPVTATPTAVGAPRPAWWRRASAPWRDLPDHLILGAMKAGTTHLDRLLAANPAVQPRPWKECRMLTEPGVTTLAYRARYDLRFRRRRRERETGRPERIGDASPYDLFHPRAPETARRLVPDARFIVILRDPAERAWSHHRHAVRHGFERLGFEAAIAAEPDRLRGEEARLAADPRATSGPHQHWSYLARGRYAVQLERWFAAFPRDRFLVLFTDHLATDPRSVLAAIQRHLDLPPTPNPPFGEIANRGDGSGPPAAIAARLRAEFAPDDERLAALLCVTPPWRIAASSITDRP